MQILTGNQRKALSCAAQRDDGALDIIKGFKGGAATRIGKALIGRKLVREMKAKPGLPVWRRDGDGREYGLVISVAGRKAIGVAKGAAEPTKFATNNKASAQSSTIESSVGRQNKAAGRRKAFAPATFAAAHADPTASIPAASTQKAVADGQVGSGTKKAQLIEMLSRSAGVSIDALMSATGWLPHTTRAALTGLRHSGYLIERSNEDEGVSVYRVLRAPVSKEKTRVAGDGSSAVADAA